MRKYGAEEFDWLMKAIETGREEFAQRLSIALDQDRRKLSQDKRA